MTRRGLSVLERIMAKVVVDANGCWVWQGCLSRGYGYVWRGGKGMVVHRLMWVLQNGPIAEGLQCDHLCRNRACCNPAHIELVTNRENTIRGLAPQMLSERHAAITHCPQGHLYDEANTYHYTRTRAGKTFTARDCRACRHLRRTNRRANQRQEQK